MDIQLLLSSSQDYVLMCYGLVFLISLLESLAFIGYLFPGLILIIGSGFLVSQGNLKFIPVVFCGAVGAIIGDVVSFYFGRHGIKFFGPNSKLIKNDHLERAGKFFSEHGIKSVFIGRFIGAFRPIIPFVAGISRMKLNKFLALAIISGILWSLSHVAMGFYFGEAWKIAVKVTTRFGIFLAIATIFVLIIVTTRNNAIKKGKTEIALLRIFFVDLKNKTTSNNFLIARIWRNLFQTEKISGLPMTLLIVTLIFTYILLLFGSLEKQYSAFNFIDVIDHKLAYLFALGRSDEITYFFRFFTFWGSTFGVMLTVGAAGLIGYIKKIKAFFLPLCATLIGAFATTFFIKMVLARSRPIDAMEIESTFSFPSAHSAIAIALYGYLCYTFMEHHVKWKNKINALITAGTLIFLIGLSRLYLGVHFFSDVFGGYLLGTLWLFFGISINQWLKKRRL